MTAVVTAESLTKRFREVQTNPVPTNPQSS